MIIYVQTFIKRRLIKSIYLFTTLVLIFHSSSASSTAVQEKDLPSLTAHRLVSHDDHTTFLMNVLKNAKKTVMISSYEMSYERLCAVGIGKAIQTARDRGIKIYIYYEHRPLYSKKIYEQLCSIADCCSRFDELNSHAKCIIQDQTILAVGSYNWLSEEKTTARNASLVLSGPLASELIKTVWGAIRYYQSEQYENDRGMESFLNDKSVFKPRIYNFSSKQYVYTLNTPEAHCDFLAKACADAQQKIQIFSPFVRLEKLRETLTPQLLRALNNKNVFFQLMLLAEPCSKAPAEKEKVFMLLEQLRSTYPIFSYATVANLHAKTLIVDDVLLCEGSFNWLSAVSDIEHEASNFEMSIAIKGHLAKRMIQAFSVAGGTNPLQRKHPEPHEEKALDLAELPKKARGYFKIFSGERFNKAGYCVYINNHYLKESDGRTTKYFVTEEQAKVAAEAILKSTDK